jgi:putative heme-binding domain-containing protein
MNRRHRFHFHRPLIAAMLSLAFLPALAEEAPPVLSILTRQLAKTEEDAARVNLLRGMNAALKGRRGITPPPEWSDVVKKLEKSSNAEVRELVQALSTVFGSSDAMDALRKIAADGGAAVDARRKAIESLIAGKDASTAELLRKLASEAGPLRADAIRGLAVFGEESTAAFLLGIYPNLAPAEKTDALATLASRPAWAKGFGKLLEEKKVARSDVSVPLLRQLRSLGDAELNASLDKHFGKMSGGSAERQAEIVKIKEWLTADFVKGGDAAKGRGVYMRTCAVCHKLFDAGAEIGPELTGSNRIDIDYLLQNIADPNALIGEDYQLNMIELKDGRFLAGMIKAQDANTMTVRTMTETTIVPLADVKAKNVSPMSMMPEGLMNAITREDARDLFRYLASPAQVPMPQ